MDTKKLRQKILDLAIHGKLVPQDPNDEPASVLLERIRAEKERLIKEGKIKKSKASKISDTPHYENVPFEVPESWCVVSLSELFMLNPKNEVEDNAEVGFIPMTNVEDGFSGDHTFEVQEWKGVKKGYCHFQNGDIGVAKISPCFENLKSCIFHSLPNGFGAGTTELVILRSMGVYSPFYLYLFKSTWYISQGTKYFKGVVGQQRVNKAIFTELEVPLPSYGEQQRIVAEIEKWFAFIDIIESGKTDLQTTIKQTKSKILDLAIHGKLVPQDPNDELASELLKRINPTAEITCDNGHYQNLLFELPCNWCWATLFDVTEFIRNGAQIKQIKGAAGIPITRIETISDSELDLSRMGYSDIFDENKYSNYYLQEGDILMSHINSRIHVGKCALCRNIPYKIIHGMNLLRICLKKEILPEYITLFFRTNIFYIQIDPYIKNAVNQASINITNLQKTLIPIPPLPEQKRIVDGVNKTFAKLDAIMENL